MSETMAVTLAGRTFEVPHLPLGVTILVYPICQRLTAGRLVERLFSKDEPLQLTPEEIGDLTELAFQAAHAAAPEVDVKAFLALPVTPAELFQAFFAMRIQCGGWSTSASKSGEGGTDAGEAIGDEMSPASTSTASLPN